ncbi:MAG: hypothetical protein LBC85_09245 [Fibromonadaceae bacterium]|jgi:hypothetical protein|nr:hypothetical protein [Fibromonadaceae bacterium]
MDRRKEKIARWFLDTKNEIWLSLIVTFVVAILLMLCTREFAKIQEPKSLVCWLLVTVEFIIIGLLSFFAVRGGIRALVYETVYNDFFVPKESKFKLIANEEGGKTFGDKIQKLRNVGEANVEQIIARFISEKLKKDFGKLTFKIDAHAYSDFAQKLLSETDEVLLANTFNPYKWLKTLFSEKMLEEVRPYLTTKKKFKAWPDNDRKKHTPPAHIQQWKEIDTNKRRRLIILDDLENLFLYEVFYLYFEYLNESSDADTRFTTYDSLNQLNINIDVERHDYVIFNKKIALEWNYDNSNNLQLIDDSQDPVVQALITINSRWDSGGAHRFENVSEIKEKINKSKKRYLQEIIEQKPSIHSYCYHAYGADCWNEINEDQNDGYKLGSREQNYLNRTFLPSLSKMELDKDPQYNVLHIGVGSGIEIENVVAGIGVAKKKISKYAIVDVSFHIIERVKEKVKQLKGSNKIMNTVFSDKNIDFIYSDPVDVTKISLSNVKYYDVFSDNTFNANDIKDKPLIIILVANGYLLSQESLLKNIFKFMRPGDYLLITTEINNSVVDGKKNEENLDKIINPYKSQSGLKLFNISLNLLGIDTVNADYYDFDFPENVKGYKNDVFIGDFLLAKWRDKHIDFKLDDTFESVDDNMRRTFDRMDKIQIFQSFKPSNRESMESYLEVFKTDEYEFVIKNVSDVDCAFKDSNKTYNQVGFVIQKEASA